MLLQGTDKNKQHATKVYLIEMDGIVEISNFEERVSSTEAHLFHNKHSAERNVVFVDVMTEDLLQDAPSFQPSIKGFVAGPGNIHGELVLEVFVLTRGNDFWITLITQVSNNVLTRTQSALQKGSENIEIGPSTTLKRSSVRHDFACTDTDANLVAQTRSIVLVGVPFARERKLFQDFEVNSIDGHQSPLSFVKTETILPDNLSVGERKPRELL